MMNIGKIFSLNFLLERNWLKTDFALGLSGS